MLLSRAAGVLVALALASGSFYLHRNDLTSVASISQLATVAVGLLAFVSLSTVTRIGHARVLERSLTEVRDLSEQLRDLAERDPLTGLYNLRTFHALLGAEIDRAREPDAPLSVVVADLDNFKSLNDSFGHQYGDAVLCETARAFDGAGGIAARLGGDEFALMLPGASRDDAVQIARAIEDVLRETRIDEKQPATLGSFGIGTFPSDGETVQALFAAADGRMYSEKHRRKADSLSTLAGAARKLFVRAGRAMRPTRRRPRSCRTSSPPLTRSSRSSCRRSPCTSTGITRR